MLFKYKVKNQTGSESNGTIEAPNLELAASSLQKKGFIIISLFPENSANFLNFNITFFNRVKFQEIVIISRQLSTLFEAKVPVIDSFKILLEETDNDTLKRHLSGIIDDIEGGLSISQALGNHPEVFSKFYTSMIKVGEESGKLDEIFIFLAEYLERSYELNSKIKNAFIYPAFVFVVFIAVIVIILIVVVPKLTPIIQESGMDIPFFTKIIIGISNSLKNFGIFIFGGIFAASFFLWRYARTEKGREVVSKAQISMPIFKKIFKEFYIARISDNLNVLLSGGVSVIRSLELTVEIVGNKVYENVLSDSIQSIKSGGSISSAFSKYKEMPKFVTQMIRIGEETGKLNFVLETISNFYRKEVNLTVDNLIKLIEPMLLLFLGGGVAMIVAAVLIPIYNIAAAM